MEIWKDIKGYEAFYQVSNIGRVRSLDRVVALGDTFKKIKGVVLKQNNHTVGYSIVSLHENSIQKSYTVHRLVANAFIENKHNKPYVNHIDGDKKNNHYLNLEWCTHEENTVHAVNNGLIKKGSKRAHSKLKESDVELIKELLKKGDSQSSISKIFNVSQSTISHIKLGKKWSHVSQ